MLPNVRTAAIGTFTALSLALGSVAPANALGNEERDFLKGAAAAVIIGAILNETRKDRAPVARYPEQPANPGWGQPRYQPPRYQPPQYEPPRANPPRYDQPRYSRPRHDAPRYDTPRYGRVIPDVGYYQSIYTTPSAQAFNSYSLTERREIQRRLAAIGYYRSSVDGAYGPGTHNAVTAYARDSGMANRLGSRDSAFSIYDGLIF